MMVHAKVGRGDDNASKGGHENTPCSHFQEIFYIKNFSWTILGKVFLIRDSRSDNAAVLLLCKQ